MQVRNPCHKSSIDSIIMDVLYINARRPLTRRITRSSIAQRMEESCPRLRLSVEGQTNASTSHPVFLSVAAFNPTRRNPCCSSMSPFYTVPSSLAELSSSSNLSVTSPCGQSSFLREYFQVMSSCLRSATM